MECTIIFGKNNESGITWKLRKEEQPFLCASHCLGNCTKVSQMVAELWCVQEILGGKKSKVHNLEAKKGGTTIFPRDTSSLPNSHSYKIA